MDHQKLLVMCEVLRRVSEIPSDNCRLFITFSASLEPFLRDIQGCHHSILSFIRHIRLSEATKHYERDIRANESFCHCTATLFMDFGTSNERFPTAERHSNVLFY